MTHLNRLLAIAPHPDDETLAAGTLLRQAVKAGAAVKVLFLTNGEGNTLGHMRRKRRLFISRQDEFLYGQERKQEARRAMALAGVSDTEFWDYCDTGLFELLAEAENELTGRLEAAIAGFRPDTVIYPSARDLHRDHSAVSLMTDFALARLGVCPRKLKYINHGALLLAEKDLQRGPEPAPEEISGKLELLKAYDTQFFINGGRWRRFSAAPESFVKDEAEYAPDFAPEFPGNSMVWVRSSFAPERLNPAALYIVGADAAGSKKCFFGRLKPGGELRLHEFSGRNGPAEIEVQPFYRGGGCYLKLPRALFSGCDRIFIKARRKLSFFDDSGFSRILLKEPRRPRPRTAAVMPCYNIALQAAQTAGRALHHADAVIAVDDGSSDGTGESLEALKAAPGGDKLEVVKLPENRGKGAALAAGFARALNTEPPFDLVVALDGDLQHHPEDIARFAEAWSNGADFICGRRAFRMDAPLRSRIGNNFINWLAARLFPNAVADTQSGFRGFSRELLAGLAGEAQTGPRYEAELNALISIMKSDTRVIELDIPAIYLDRNRTSHFRPLADSTRIVLALLAGAFSGKEAR
jgi:LmbE family N-acetylglucosaminyl deacetylase